MKPRIMLIDDDTVFIEDLLHHLGDLFDWITLESGRDALGAIQRSLPDVVLLDIDLGSEPGGFQVLSSIRREVPRTPVVMVTRHDPSQMAADAWRLGAFGYIEKGSSIQHLVAHIERAIEEATLHRENESLREEIVRGGGHVVGQSRAMTTLMSQIPQVANTPSTVLITGESGTGKGVIARELHAQSPRSKQPFVRVSLPALSETLVESELFGHERGAFTGAIARHVGSFERAHRGTIFLDEISEIPPRVQAKLLHVLQDRTFERVGGAEAIAIDVRIIAATNKNLEGMVSEGSFRQDLYYRLRVVPIDVPPLRERREDIPLLVQTKLDELAVKMNRARCRLSSSALDRLIAWDWPGNVRELENVLENALVHSQDDLLGEELFAGLVGSGAARLGYEEAKTMAIQRFERDYVDMMLRECGGNISEAARRMDITRQGLQKMIKRLGIKRAEECQGEDL
jgi:two-component system response regulator AtoC